VLVLEPLDGERRQWEALLRPAETTEARRDPAGADGSPVVEIGERTVGRRSSSR
jgi:hypothetical protein